MVPPKKSVNSDRILVYAVVYCTYTSVDIVAAAVDGRVRAKVGVPRGATSLTTDVYREIKRQIVTSELPPGALLQEVEVSERLKVSRTPVREALRMLQAEGLVTLVPRRGAQVTQFSPQDLEDAYEARTWLETAAAGKTACVITPDALQRLEEVLSSTPSDPRTHDDAVAAEKGDLQFHDLILQASGNRLVRDLVGQLRITIQRAAYFVPPGRHHRSWMEHQAILSVLKEHDSDKASALVREHILAARRRVFGER